MSKAASPKTDRLREMREANAVRREASPGARVMDALIETIGPDKLLDHMRVYEEIKAQVAAQMASKGGKSKSPAKIAAAKQNGMKGGKPKRLG